MTHRDNKRLIRKLNSRDAIDVFEDKVKFARAFAPYFGRACLELETASPDDVFQFLTVHGQALLKPRSEAQGRGIRVITRDGLREDEELLRIGGHRRGGDWFLEARLVQHSTLSQAFGSGLMPLRLVSGLISGTTEVLIAAVTIGVADKVVNYHIDGVMAPVDVSTGQIAGPAVAKDGTIHWHHPLTGHSIEGFQLPMWDRATALVDAAAKVIPNVRYIGWDVGLTQAGPVIMEGNHDPGTYSMVQRSIYRDRKGGIRSSFARFL